VAGLTLRPEGVFADMTLSRGVKHAADEDTKHIIYGLARRVAAVKPFQDHLKEVCERVDKLLYAEAFSAGGADQWADDPSATEPGRSHISLNMGDVYVEVPAALQATEPIENIVANDTTPQARAAAAAVERLYVAWKQDEDFDLKWHKAIYTKSAYGISAGRLYMKKQSDGKWKPCLTIVDQPRNLYIGYKTDEYEEPEWAAYVTRYEPNALIEAFGVDVLKIDDEDGTQVPLVVPGVTEVGSSAEFPDSWAATPVRTFLNMGDARIEVWDYWYRQPVWRGSTFVRMDTYNVVIAGNYVIRGPLKYPEYDGELPYKILYNTYVPGLPTGKSDLFDLEPLIREKQELLTAGSQMIANGVAGDMWQLVGPDSPRNVPPGLKPRRNELVGPGPGNRIEAITPFIAQFQLEGHLDRIDREMAEKSGLNELLIGLAPAQVLSSSKAINALSANYETRLSIRRKLLYKWRRNVWELALKMWAHKDDTIAQVIADGSGFLDITDPSLSPRDESETAVRAANLVAAKLISQSTGMDMVGVDDPETEKAIIREESTDATLWPDRVQVMAQLLAALQQLGLQAPGGATEQAQGQMTSGQADLRQALGAATPQVGPGATGAGGEPSMMGQTPPIAGLPPEAGGAPAPFAQAPAPGSSTVLQGMVQGGKAKGRIMTQQKLGRR
jgi:hypothetical protein